MCFYFPSLFLPGEEKRRESFAIQVQDQQAKVKGFLHKDGQTLFPIVFYELPQDNIELERYVCVGINLFRCSGKDDLDRVAAAGAMGWVPLNLTLGRMRNYGQR